MIIKPVDESDYWKCSWLVVGSNFVTIGFSEWRIIKTIILFPMVRLCVDYRNQVRHIQKPFSYQALKVEIVYVSRRDQRPPISYNL